MNSNVHPIFANVLRSIAPPPSDHYEGLRSQRREHMSNAVWWRRRYQGWGSPMALKWFRAEARSHRVVSRELWKHGTN